jgi:DNA-damage-inducible protein J
MILLDCIDNVITLYILLYMTTLNIRINQEIKSSANAVLTSLGMDMSGAIKIFLSQVIIDQGLPFVPSTKSVSLRQKWDTQVQSAKKSKKSYTNGIDALSGL